MARTQLRRTRNKRESPSSPREEDAEAPIEEEDEPGEEVTTSVEAVKGKMSAVLPENVLPVNVTATKKSRPKLTVDHLMKAEGLEWLRDHMPKVAKFKKKDDVADA